MIGAFHSLGVPRIRGVSKRAKRGEIRVGTPFGNEEGFQSEFARCAVLGGTSWRALMFITG